MNGVTNVADEYNSVSENVHNASTSLHANSVITCFTNSTVNFSDLAEMHEDSVDCKNNHSATASVDLHYPFDSSASLQFTESKVSPSTSKSPKKTCIVSRNHSVSSDKQSDEYRQKRERNNRFVRACREKARQRHNQVEHRVSELLSENKQLCKRVDALTRELNIYRNLSTSVGAAIPREVDLMLDRPIPQPSESCLNNNNCG